MPGWMKYKLESTLLGEISITSDMQITPPLWQKAKRNYRASMQVKEESKKAKMVKCWNITLKKWRSWHLVPSLHGKLVGKQGKEWETLFWGGSKITADGDCSHEIKRCLLLGRKVMTNLGSILKSRGITLPTKVPLSSVQFTSVAQSCLTLCDPMNRSTLGLPVHHQLPEFTQTHVHRVGDAIQPSHPLSSPSPPASNPSQHQSLFQWVNSLHEVAKVLEFQL